MNPINLTPDMLRTLLQHTNEYPLPGPVARNLLDFTHETLRNAEHLNDAALDLMGAADILYTCRTLTKDYTRNRAPGGPFREATELQYGEGAEEDPELNLVYVSALLNATGATGTTEPLSDAAELLARLGHALYTPEDDR